MGAVLPSSLPAQQSEPKTQSSPGMPQSQQARARLSLSSLLNKVGFGRRAQLSPDAKKQIMELFNKMDVDGNREVSREEAERFFQGKFGLLSANAMFNEVDVDNSDVIT